MSSDPPHIGLLTRWSTERADSARRRGLALSSVQNVRPDAAAYLDIDGHAAVARVIVWPGLEADLEVLDLTTSEQRVFQHFERLTVSDLDRAIEIVTTANSGARSQERQLTELTAAMVKSYVRSSTVKPDEIEALIAAVARTLAASAGSGASENPKLAKLSETPRSERVLSHRTRKAA